MEYIVIIILLLAFIIIKSTLDSKARYRKLLIKLEENWGEVPEEEYTSEKLKSLDFYYSTIKNEKMDIDQITWNDLEMDQIFMVINNTSSAIGEEYLYGMLKNLCFEQKELEERNRLIHFFQENKETRLKLQALLSNMGKFKSVSVYEYVNRVNDIESVSPLKHILRAVALLASVGFIFVNPTVGIIAFFTILASNVISYYKCKASIEKYYDIFSYIIKMLGSIKELMKLDIPEINRYQEDLKKCDSAFGNFRKGAFLITSGRGMSGGLEDVILDYLRIMFHIDLIKFWTMLKTVKEQNDKLNLMFQDIGYLDSMIAVASFRELMGTYSEPCLEYGKKPYIKVEQMYHPLIPNPVTNSISENQSVLITGSNASGKSTFIKTLAINAILAQTIYTTMTRSYHSSYFKVYSSMALRDDLLSRESYYIVEIKSLKRILDQAAGEVPVLCFVDEVLRGTNTLERIAASAQILHSLALSNTLCFSATHDIELTHILEKYYSNYHFQEQVRENEVIFDYQLYEGRAVSRNAIKLLGIMGYSKEIIEKAENAANEFLEKGQWDSLD